MEEDSTSVKINLSDLNEFSKILDLNAIIDRVKYISLETNHESLVSEIEQLSIYRDCIYVLDNKNKSLLVFSEDGRFIRKIGKQGKGPQEYINPIYFTIDQNKIMILDDGNSKILTYSLDGDFLEETNIGLFLNEFLVLSDSTLLINTDSRTNHHNEAIENFKLLIVDSMWNVAARGNVYNSYQCGNISFARAALYFSSNKSILYNPMFSYTIYELKGRDFLPKYTFNVEGMKLPENFECGLDLDDFIRTYTGPKSPYTYIDKPIVESSDWLVTTFKHKNQNAYMFYNKNTTETYWGTFYNDDADSFVYLASMMGITDKGQFYSHTSSLQLKNRYLNYEKETGKRNDQLASVNEGDNPVIIFYDLKK